MIKVRKTSAIRADYREIENKQGGATVYLYGDIGGWFGIDNLEWVKEFNAIDADTIHLRVDSDGGDIFAARTMKTAVMQHKAKVVAHIDGIAASAASFAIMGADEIEIVDGGFLMVHNALSMLDILGFFNQADGLKLIEDLNKEFDGRHTKINESIANDYAKRTGVDLDVALQWMENETWFTAEEALENKLVDRVYDGEPVEGKYDLSIYNNVPKELKIRNQSIQGNKKDLNERDLEKNLRDAGYSRNQAKEIVAKVFHSEREVQDETIIQDVRDAQIDNEQPLRDAEKPEKKKDKTTELLNKAKLITI